MKIAKLMNSDPCTSSNVEIWDLRKKNYYFAEIIVLIMKINICLKKDYKILSEKVFEIINLSQIKICDEIYEKLLKDLSIN